MSQLLSKLIAPMETHSPYVARVGDPYSNLDYYLRDVRRFPLLTRESERALTQHLQEKREQWCALLLNRLLYIPLLLSWGPKIRRGLLPVTTLFRAGSTPPPTALRLILQRLHWLRCQMRQLMMTDKTPEQQKVLAIQEAMQALLPNYEWQLAFLHKVWQRFDRAMTLQNITQQSRPATAYVMTLGHSLQELSAMWHELSPLYTQMEQAKQEMVNCNLRLVLREAYRFRYTGLAIHDLIQEGNIGLMRAVDGFDYRRNLKFSNYAVWWIRQTIQRARLAQLFMHLPEYLRESARRAQRVREIFLAEHGRAPSAEEIAQRGNIPLQHIELSLMHALEPVSLDNLLPGQKRAIKDLIPDTHLLSSNEAIRRNALKRSTQRALACLTQREAIIISRRFGLDDGPAETLEQIGCDVGLSRERVRQLVLSALEKLKKCHDLRLASLES